MELIGAQGVGKSTLAGRVHRSLKHQWFFHSQLKALAIVEPVNPKPEMERLIMEIFYNKLQLLEGSMLSARRKLTLCRQMTQIIDESLMLSANVYPRGFLLDEGLFKHFAREILHLGVERTAPLWERRAFVHVRARTPELVAARFQERAAKRRRRGIFQHLASDEELRAQTALEDGFYEEICAQARSLGRPCITIHVDDGIESNARSILQFQRMLCA
ncbi:hypothetical protein SAMN05444336_11328 [Albimonas donghaensis]|uniref:Thymidylate kinase n=1 Tax=Albimonas donghaensis TaxID=356660 RepID=A0A1H3FQM0_9RHOB|nr:hypothetical protein [Albimonas donghaensis]SDX92444.1 hypothetical protein SAMN05444336_11328 [Albimonas donghaensis]